MKQGFDGKIIALIFLLSFILFIPEINSAIFNPIEPVSSDKPIEVSINNSDLDLSTIDIITKDGLNNSVEVIELNETKELIAGLPVGKLYRAFEVKIPQGSSEIINVTFEFRINKTWFKENNITVHFNPDRYWLLENEVVGNVKLFKKFDFYSEWAPLDANFSRADRDYYYFKSYSSGFSVFAIFFNKYDCLPNSVRCEGNKVQLCLGNSTWLVTETCMNDCTEGKCENTFFKSNEFFTLLLTIIGGITLIVLIVLARKLKISKKDRFHKILFFLLKR